VIVDRMPIRRRLMLLVFGSLMFVMCSMGAIAVAGALRQSQELEQRFAMFPEARAIHEAAKQETAKGSAKMGTAATVLLLFTFACALIPSRDIVRRLNQLRDAAKRMRDGDLDSPVPIEARTELDQLAHALDHMRGDLRRVVALSIQKAEHEDDLSVASTVHAMFLPKAEVFESGGVHLTAFYKPASRCGGDYWWRGTLRDGSTLLFVGDVTGHGTGPAMITAAVASTLHTLLSSGERPDMSDLLHTLNRSLRVTCQGRFFMTLSAVLIDPHAQRLDCWNAGAPPLFIMDENGDIDVVAVSGSRLGETEPQFGHRSVELSGRARLLAFTDGIPERTLPSGHTLGLRRLRRMFADSRNETLVHAADLLKEAVSDGVPQDDEDDITFVMVDIVPSAKAAC